MQRLVRTPPARRWAPCILSMHLVWFPLHPYCPVPDRASQVPLVVKNLSASVGDVRDSGLTPGSGRSSGGGHGNLLRYSCLKNPMDRGTWQASVYGVAESRTRRKWLSTAQKNVCLITECQGVIVYMFRLFKKVYMRVCNCALVIFPPFNLSLYNSLL